MNDSGTFNLDDAEAKRVCEVVSAAGGALSGLVVGGVYSAGTAGTAAAAMGTGGLALLFLGGALMGLAVGRYFCGTITDKIREQTASMTKEDFKKFGIVMASYGTFRDDELQILAKVGFQYISINTINACPVLPAPSDKLRKGLSSILALYSTKSSGNLAQKS